jgi:hypothetical protein
MAKQYRAVRREEKEGYEKPFWKDVGLTLIVYEKDGKTKYMIEDARAGDVFMCYEKKKPEDRETVGSQQQSAPPSDDAVPF